MKNILIPTDFSVNAGFAINYGGRIASALNANITLLHAFNVPVFSDVAVLQQSTIETWENDNQLVLNEISDRLEKNNPNIQVNRESRFGYASETILEFAASHKFDMIIMGSKGNGNIGDTLFGNVTTDVVRESHIPVLIIPPGVNYKPLKDILLACHNEELITEQVTKTVTTFVKTFESKLFILDVIRQYAGEMSEYDEETIKIKSHFSDLMPSAHIIEDEKVVHGINEFADANDIDMVVMVPEKHSFFERMFTEIHTRHMARATQRPLLVIPKN